jgi:hypothetical protein
MQITALIPGLRLDRAALGRSPELLPVGEVFDSLGWLQLLPRRAQAQEWTAQGK